MKKKQRNELFDNLPQCAAEFIKLVIKKMRYRKKVRQDVQAELAAHFEDELKDLTTDKEKEQKAQQLINEFGDAKLLGVLLRRAKKRCRPLWRTAVVRSFQAIGVITIFLCVYTLWFLTGKPTISVDYLALLNQMNRPQVLDADNAWPHYEKAIDLLVEPNDSLDHMDAFRNYNETQYKNFGNLTEARRERIRQWVQQNEVPWQEFVRGSKKPYCYRQYEYSSKNEDKWLFYILMPHLKPLRYLAKTGIWRARMEMERGLTQQALEDCLVIARAGSHWQGRGFMTELLVGISIAARAYHEMLYIAATQKLSAKELKMLQQRLSQIYPGGIPLVNFIESERLMFLDTIQHLFTKGGPGGGHLVPNQWISFRQQINMKDYGPDLEKYLIIPYAGAAMLHARRDETIARANEIYDKLSEIEKMTPYQQQHKNIDANKLLLSLPPHRYRLIYVFTPAVRRLSEIMYQHKVTYEAVLSVLALQRWRLEKGQYPQQLDQLVAAGYLNELPMDPFGDGPLRYQKRGEDFLLYSLGLDFDDDGGKPGRDKKGKTRMWSEDGDAVFWPIEK